LVATSTSKSTDWTKNPRAFRSGSVNIPSQNVLRESRPKRTGLESQFFWSRCTRIDKVNGEPVIANCRLIRMGRSIIARVAVAFRVLKSLLFNSGRCKKKMRLSGTV
jgi:hypothetical protein